MNRFFTLLLAAFCLTAVGQSDDCVEDLDLDGIDDVDSCVGIIDILGVCNGGCLQNLDGDFICDDQDLSSTLRHATTMTQPTTNVITLMNAVVLVAESGVVVSILEDFFYEMNLVLAPNCISTVGYQGW